SLQAAARANGAPRISTRELPAGVRRRSGRLRSWPLPSTARIPAQRLATRARIGSTHTAAPGTWPGARRRSRSAHSESLPLFPQCFPADAEDRGGFRLVAARVAQRELDVAAFNV